MSLHHIVIYYMCQRTKCTSLHCKYAIKLVSMHLHLNNFDLFQFFHNEERLVEDIWVEDAWTRAEFLHEVRWQEKRHICKINFVDFACRA